MLFKEHVVVFPALPVLLDLATGRLREPRDVRRWIPFAVLLAGVAANYLVLRWIVLDGSLSGRAAAELPFMADPRVRFLTALSLWPECARLLFFPAELSAMYDPATLMPQRSLSPRVILGGLILFGGSISLLGERTLYMPSVAVGIRVGFGARRLLGGRVLFPAWTDPGGRDGLRRSALAALILLCGVLWVWTVARDPVRRDNATLFPVTLRGHPESFRAHWFEALRAAEAGDSLASARSWRRARSIDDRNSTFPTREAALLRARGETASAIRLVDSLAGKGVPAREDSP